MEKAKGYFACSGCQWHSIRDSQLASSWPYKARRGELKPCVMLFSGQYPQVDTFLFPRTQQFYDSQHTVIIVAVKPLSLFSFYTVLELICPNSVWNLKGTLHGAVKKQRHFFCLRKAHWAERQSKQKRLPLVIFWYRSHVVIVRKHEN